jgi:hypothetical protein
MSKKFRYCASARPATEREEKFFLESEVNLYSGKKYKEFSNEELEREIERISRDEYDAFIDESCYASDLSSYLDVLLAEWKRRFPNWVF